MPSAAELIAKAELTIRMAGDFIRRGEVRPLSVDLVETYIASQKSS